MIIDFHTHTFPEQLSAKTLNKLSHTANMVPYTAGTNESLRASMQKAGIDYSVILPIATSPSQHKTINDVAEEVNEHTAKTGLISFGTLHPDNENYKEILADLANRGFLGIKLHPVFVNTPIDDERFVRIIDYAANLGLMIVLHAGYDRSYPGVDAASPKRIHALLRQVVPEKLVLAHMGGWGDWEYVTDHLLTYPIYLDTSFVLTKVVQKEPWPGGIDPFRDVRQHMSQKEFISMVRAIGADHVLLGSDSPWSRQDDSADVIRNSGLADKEVRLILGDNAARLLHLS